jgi:hypothetical protein
MQQLFLNCVLEFSKQLSNQIANTHSVQYLILCKNIVGSSLATSHTKAHVSSQLPLMFLLSNYKQYKVDCITLTNNYLAISHKNLSTSSFLMN